MTVTTKMTTTIQAIIFRRTIRASYASLDLVRVNDGDGYGDAKEEHIVAILQCPNTHVNDGAKNRDGDDNDDDDRITVNISSWRSNIRRICKLGTEIELIGSWWCETTKSTNNNTCQARRFRVEYYQNHETHNQQPQREVTIHSYPFVKVVKVQKWDMIKCQSTREKYYPGFDHDNKNKNKNKSKMKSNQKEIRVNANSDAQKKSITSSDGNINGGDRNMVNVSHPSLSQRKQKIHEGQTGHGGGLGKRKQGEIVADFFIELLTGILQSNENENGNSHECDKISSPPSMVTQKETCKRSDDDSQNSALLNVERRFVNIDELKKMNEHFDAKNRDEEYYSKRKKTIEYLNGGSGVMDVAGGSGHLSLALALSGIKSTVIDPRETVGLLPGRDRKALRKALKNRHRPKESGFENNDGKNYTASEQIIMPPIEFASMRAWFSKRPDGVDVEFREGRSPSLPSSSVEMNSDEFIPICTECSSDGLLSSCSAIVALHPDEATGDIVDFAVKHKIPFLVVPCCVFSRLFPNRYKPLKRRASKEKDKPLREIVSTYEDLIEYLVSKDESIRITKMKFEGANLALWSMFDKKYY